MSNVLTVMSKAYICVGIDPQPLTFALPLPKCRWYFRGPNAHPNASPNAQRKPIMQNVSPNANPWNIVGLGYERVGFACRGHVVCRVFVRVVFPTPTVSGEIQDHQYLLNC